MHAPRHGDAVGVASGTMGREELRSGPKGQCVKYRLKYRMKVTYVACKVERASGSDLVFNVYIHEVRFN